MGNRDKMRGPMSLEEYATQQVRDWADQPVDLSGLGKLPEIGAAPSILRPLPRPHLNSDITEAVTVQAMRPPIPAPRIADQENATTENSRIARGLEETAKYTGRMVDGQHFGTAGLLQVTRGPKPYRALRAINRIAPIFKGTGAGFGVAEEAVGAVGDLQDGVPLKVVAPGALLHGGGSVAASAVGGLLGGLFFGPAGVIGGAMAGNSAADRWLPSRKVLGQQVLKAADTYGKNPFFGML